MADKIAYDLIKEVREEQKDIREDISSIKTILHVNTLSLQEHIEGVKTLKELHKQNAGRIEVLEEEKKIKEAVRKKFWALVAGSTAILSLIAAWAKVKGIL